MSPRTPFKCWQRVCVSVGGPSCFSYFRGLVQIFSSSTPRSLCHPFTALNIGYLLLLSCPFTFPSVHRPLRCPELGALPGHCRGVRGRGSRGPSGWSQTRSYGGPGRQRKNVVFCLTPNWQSFVSCYSLTFFDGHCYSQAHHQQQTHL